MHCENLFCPSGYLESGLRALSQSFKWIIRTTIQGSFCNTKQLYRGPLAVHFVQGFVSPHGKKTICKSLTYHLISVLVFLKRLFEGMNSTLKKKIKRKRHFTYTDTWASCKRMFTSFLFLSNINSLTMCEGYLTFVNKYAGRLLPHTGLAGLSRHWGPPAENQTVCLSEPLSFMKLYPPSLGHNLKGGLTLWEVGSGIQGETLRALINPLLSRNLTLPPLSVHCSCVSCCFTGVLTCHRLHYMSWGLFTVVCLLLSVSDASPAALSQVLASEPWKPHELIAVTTDTFGGIVLTYCF